MANGLTTPSIDALIRRGLEADSALHPISPKPGGPQPLQAQGSAGSIDEMIRAGLEQDRAAHPSAQRPTAAPSELPPELGRLTGPVVRPGEVVLGSREARQIEVEERRTQAAEHVELGLLPQPPSPTAGREAAISDIVREGLLSGKGPDQLGRELGISPQVPAPATPTSDAPIPTGAELGASPETQARFQAAVDFWQNPENKRLWTLATVASRAGDVLEPLFPGGEGTQRTGVSAEELKAFKHPSVRSRFAQQFKDLKTPLGGSRDGGGPLSDVTSVRILDELDGMSDGERQKFLGFLAHPSLRKFTDRGLLEKIAKRIGWGIERVEAAVEFFPRVLGLQEEGGIVAAFDAQATLRVQDPAEGASIVEDAVLSVAEIAPAMAASVPLGPVAGTVFWTQQIAPEVFVELRKMGVPTNMARAGALLFAIPEAAIEVMQVRGLLPKGASSEVVRKSFWAHMRTVFKNYLIRAGKEIGEEGGQAATRSLGKAFTGWVAEFAGNKDIDFSNVGGPKQWAEEMQRSVLPLLLLSGPGSAFEAVNRAELAEQGIERPPAVGPAEAFEAPSVAVEPSVEPAAPVTPEVEPAPTPAAKPVTPEPAVAEPETRAEPGAGAITEGAAVAAPPIAKPAPAAPETLSVAGTGKPVTVRGFHGTTASFDAFDPAKRGANTGAPSAFEGVFFAADEGTAQSYLRSLDITDVGSTDVGTFDDLESLTAHMKTLDHDVLADAVDGLATEVLGIDGSRIVRKFFSDGKLKDADAFWDWWEFRSEGFDTDFGEVLDILKRFEPRVIEADITMQNPLVHDVKGVKARKGVFSGVIKKAKASGHDGVIFLNAFDGAGKTTIYAAFNEAAIAQRGAVEPAPAAPAAEAAEERTGILNEEEQTQVDEIKARVLKRFKTTLRAGLDADTLADMAKAGAIYIKAGVREFGKWSARMVEQLGENVKPHLQGIWDSLQKAEKKEVREPPAQASAKETKKLIREAVEKGTEGEKIALNPKQLLRVAFRKVEQQARKVFLAAGKELVQSKVDMAAYAKEKLGDAAGSVLKTIAQARTRTEQVRVFASIDALAEKQIRRAAEGKAVNAYKDLKKGLRTLADPYHGLAKDILEQFQPSTPTARTLISLDSMERWADAHPDEAALLPDKHLERLARLSKMPIRLMELDDLTELANRIEYLTMLSSRTRALAFSKKVRKFRDDIEASTEEIDASRPKDLAAWRQTAFDFTKNIWRSGNRVEDMTRRRDTPTLRKLLVRDLTDSEVDSAALSVPARERVDIVATESVGGTLLSGAVGRKLQVVVEVKLPDSLRGRQRITGAKMTVRDLAGLALQLRDPRTRVESVKSGWTWGGDAVRGVTRPTESQDPLFLSEDAMNGLEAQLPDGFSKVIDAIHKEYNNPDRLILLEKEVFDGTGLRMEPRKDYAPSHRNMEERPSAQTQFGGQIVRQLGSIGILQKTVKSKLSFEVRDFVAEFTRNNELTASIASGELSTIQRAAAIAGQPAVKQRIRSKWGAESLRAIENHLEYAFNVATGGTTQKPGEFDRGVRRRIRATTRALISLNPSTMMLQPTSAPLTIKEVSLEAAAFATKEFIKNPRAAVRKMLAANPLARRRYGDSVLLLHGAPHGIGGALTGRLESSLDWLASHTFRYGDMGALAGHWLAIEFDGKKAGWSAERIRKEFHATRQNIAPSDSPAMRTRLEIAGAKRPILGSLAIFKNYTSRLRSGLINDSYDALRENTPDAWGKFSKSLAAYLISQLLASAVRVFWRRQRRKRKRLDSTDWWDEAIAAGATLLHPLAGGLVWAIQAAVGPRGDVNVAPDFHVALVNKVAEVVGATSDTVKSFVGKDEWPGLTKKQLAKEQAKLKKNLVELASVSYEAFAVGTGAPIAPARFIENFFARNSLQDRGYYYDMLWYARDEKDAASMRTALEKLNEAGVEFKNIRASAKRRGREADIDRLEATWERIKARTAPEEKKPTVGAFR